MVIWSRAGLVQKYAKKIFLYLSKKGLFVKSFLVFVFFFVLNSLLYLTVPGVSSMDDQWFYFKIADLLRTSGWAAISDFKWLYFTNLAQDHLNYALTLHHFFLVPFTFFHDKIFGMKLAGTVLASIVPALIYFVWTKFKFKRAFLWALFLYVFLSADILWRLFINRGFVLIDGLIFLEIYFLYQKKYWSLFLISSFHTWWHPGTFWLVPVIVVTYELIRYINTQKFFIRGVILGIAGACLGFLFFPANSDQLFSSMRPGSWIESLTSYFYGVNNAAAIPEGVEVYKKDFFTVFNDNSILFISFVFLIVLNVFLYIHKKSNGNKDMDENTDRVILREFLFICSIIFVFGVLAISYRFQDVAQPCIFLGLAVAVQFFSERGFLKINDANIKMIVMISIVIFFSYFFLNRVLDVRNSINNMSYLKYEKAANWLKANTKKNEIIFNTDWSEAPGLFFYDDWNYYIVGLEPKSLYRYNKKLYWLWHNISYNGVICNRQENCSDESKKLTNKTTKNGGYDSEMRQLMADNAKSIAPIIKESFQSRYIFFSKNLPLKKEIDEDKDDYEMVYSDTEDGVYIYQIK